MGKKSPPPAPDYTAAANAQAEASAKNTLAQTIANRPDVMTPWGSQSWQQNGDQWMTNIELSPQQQEALDSQMAVTTGRSRAAEGLLGQATGAFNNPMDYSGVTAGGQPFSPQQAQSGFDGGGQIQRGFDGAGDIQRGFSMGGDVQRGVGSGGDIQSGFGPAGDIQSRMSATAGDWRQRGQDAALAFMRPQQEQRQAALETQLANQGLTRGSQAWNTEMQRNSDQTTRDQLQAFGAGQSEAGQLFNQDLQGSQFANQAQNQRFGQNQAQAAFGNQAQNQRFGQGVDQGQFANQAQAQEYDQNRGLAAFGNQSQGQEFAQNQAQAGFANQAQNQAFGQGQTQGAFANQAASQNNAANLQASNFNQQLRQQQIAEMLQQRNQPLNELNALLSGQQINSPNMPTFNTAGKSETPQLLNAANAGYQANMDAFNAKSAGTAGLMSGIGSVAALFSDERLKDDIKPLFSLGDDNIKLYSFNYKPTGEKKVGVMAQEVRKKRPDAVMKDPETGFLKVDYNKVFQ